MRINPGPLEQAGVNVRCKPPCPSVGGFARIYGLLRRKNRFPVGGVMVMLFVPLAVVML